MSRRTLLRRRTRPRSRARDPVATYPYPRRRACAKIANLGDTPETGLRSHDARTKKAEAVAFWRGPLGPIEALLPEGVDTKRLCQMPASYRRSYVRTVQGKASPRTAIRVFCLECIG